MAGPATSGGPPAEQFRAERQATEVLDRGRPVRFSFNGQAIPAFGGDTIVSALMASGIRSYAQGRRLQTKRGVLSADRFDPCVLQVDDEPNVAGAHQLVADGQRVRSQHVWPSLRFDLKAVNQRATRLLRSDSQLRASTAAGFLRPAYRWLASRGDVGGRVAPDGGGRGELRVGQRHVDVLVVGGGLAGLAAGEAAARAGARTLVVEADHEPGGWVRLSGDPALTEVLGRLDGLDGFDLWTDAVVVDLDRDGQAVVVAGRPEDGEDLTVVRARHVILASGLVERTLTFTGNDLPGVMLATAARRLTDLWAVRPGRRAVVLTANGHGDAAVDELARVGVEVAQVVDARRGGGIQRANGSSELTEVVLADRSVIAADVLVVAPGWTVDAALAVRAGAQLRDDGAAGRPTVEGRPGVLGVVGALAGDAALDQVVGHATVTGRQGAAAALRGSAGGAAARPLTSVAGVGARRAAPPQPPLGRPSDELNLESVSVGVVDFGEDVTAFELVGKDPVTTGRLLTAAAAAPAVGARARAELADLGRRVPGVGHLAVPLLTGQSGAVQHFAVGPRLGSLARLADRPVRRTPLVDCHLAAGARLERRGEWLDAAHYGDPAAERQALERSAGLRDTGRTALFDLQGDDAARLVNLLIGGPTRGSAGGAVNGAPADVVARPSVGGVLEASDAAGHPLLVARLGEEHWQLRVEPADAAAVEGTVLTLVHIEHRNWRVYLASAGEAQAGLALVGPRSGSLVEAVFGVRPGTAEVVVLPEGRAAGGHVWSYTSAGRAVVELRVPAGRAEAVWHALLESGASDGVRPVGFLALEGADGD